MLKINLSMLNFVCSKIFPSCGNLTNKKTNISIKLNNAKYNNGENKPLNTNLSIGCGLPKSIAKNIDNIILKKQPVCNTSKHKATSL